MKHTRITIVLDELDYLVRQTARECDVSIAEVIRRAVARYFGRTSPMVKIGNPDIAKLAKKGGLKAAKNRRAKKI